MSELKQPRRWKILPVRMLRVNHPTSYSNGMPLLTLKKKLEQLQDQLSRKNANANVGSGVDHFDWRLIDVIERHHVFPSYDSKREELDQQANTAFALSLMVDLAKAEAPESGFFEAVHLYILMNVIREVFGLEGKPACASAFADIMGSAQYLRGKKELRKLVREGLESESFVSFADLSIMSAQLQEEISNLRKPKWVSLKALMELAPTALSWSNYISISLLGRGSCNFAYKLVFQDGLDVAVSISKEREENFNVTVKLSEMSTILYIQENQQHYHQIPVSKVYIWDLSFSNPIGAPYVFMDVVKGVPLNERRAPDGRKGLDSLCPSDQLKVVNTLAAIQASLSGPIHFNQFGSISRTAEGGYSVELLQIISVLIPHFTPPEAYTSLVLHHLDLVFRNILFDEDDLTKITGVIDWGGAQHLLLIFTAHFPDDLLSTGREHCERPDYPDEYWQTVPHDWTSLGDTSPWPQAFRNPGDPVDLPAIGATMIKRYYLRQYFGACFSKHMKELHGDTDLHHTTVFKDATYYLKFHEVIMSGFDGWLSHEKWIRETFSRLKIIGSPAGKLLAGLIYIVVLLGNLFMILGSLSKQKRTLARMNK
ncbi:hypothetical protein M422DRAFT_779617 [Sphaerobolus stellatus SS14]|uniref:Aminoglycoside phosphotransferase domain-containing protein n=1 Tax=Sphaerobolus stellatus (strain SS14) TaxID=990650 RepID=A0A0C9VAW7_SPHS4|nr:hypothetical protein M422DRAFT_779617 [Sphaerobolus stellatus SS14]